jgi:hypothetical protein
VNLERAAEDVARFRNRRVGRLGSTCHPASMQVCEVPHTWEQINLWDERRAAQQKNRFDRRLACPGPQMAGFGASRPVPSPLGEGRVTQAIAAARRIQSGPLFVPSTEGARRLLRNRGVHYSLNCAERQRTAAGTPSAAAIWRKRAPSSVVVA